MINKLDIIGLAFFKRVNKQIASVNDINNIN